MMLLDTNIVIGYLAGDTAIAKWIEGQNTHGEIFVLSVISVAELLGFSKITDVETLAIEHWLKSVVIIDVDLSISRAAAAIRRQYNLTTTDCLIAATAELTGTSLVTRDKVFKKLKRIKIVNP